jgi:hypothetical protein
MHIGTFDPPHKVNKIMSILSFSMFDEELPLGFDPRRLHPKLTSPDAQASSTEPAQEVEPHPAIAASSETALELTDEDQERLKEFNKMLDVIEDYASGVCNGYRTGFYLSGRGGTGKSLRVKNTVEGQQKSSSVWKKAKMSPTGFWELLSAHPDSVIVLDDVTTLFSKREAKDIFLAALDGEPWETREVPMTIHGEARSVPFTGGVIAISNLPIADDPVARAMGSRFTKIDHNPTDEMLIAAMRSASIQGFYDDKEWELLSPEKCWKVCNFIIDECRTSNIRIDLRELKKGWNTYRQWQSGETKLDWRELVRASLQKPITTNMLSERQRREIDQEETALMVFQRLTVEGKVGDKKAATEAWHRCYPPPSPGHSVDRYYAALKRLRAKGRH